MGFTENYLERRKKRTGQSLTVAPLEKEAAPAASSGSRAGNDFTARYLARRESRTVLPEVPALSLPSLPGSAASSPAEAMNAAFASVYLSKIRARVRRLTSALASHSQ